MDVAADAVAGSGLLAASFFYGVRHGFDVDHLAAIADISGVPSRVGRALWLSTLYALGHAAVLLIFGATAIIIGLRVPPAVEGAMERIVGVTLLALGGYLAFRVFKDGSQVRLRSRWSLVGEGARRSRHWLAGGHHHPPDVAEPTSDGRARSSLVTGALHGVGAETPTQILLFGAAAGAADTRGGVLVLITFVAGLFLANTFVASVCAFGFQGAERLPALYLVMAGTTAVLSIIVGGLYVLGRADALGVLLGG